MANPCEMTRESPLFNIATGKSVILKTENFLLNIDIIGDTERNMFIDECTERPKRFEERIKKQKLSQQKLEKKRITSKDGNIALREFSLVVFWNLPLKANRYQGSTKISINACATYIISC